MTDCVTIEDVHAAAERISGSAVRTPVMTSRSLDAMVGATVLLKCESFQRVGAFKFRGAYNALSRLAASGRGALAYSSGNHAQGVALASAMLGVRAVIVMPANAPAVKVAATRGYLACGGVEGSEVVTYDPSTTVREELGAEIAERLRLTIVPPYDHPHIIAGQGTAALELFEDAGSLDDFFVCCGGGGLLSGCAVVAKAVAPACRVVGVEPSLGDDVTQSFRTGRLHEVRNPDTIADGARTPRPGRHTFALVHTHVDEMMTVEDDELRRMMRFAFERMKLVVEPSGVLGLAGLVRRSQEQPESVRGRRIGVLISGGNVDPAVFSALIDGGAA
ncbi:MAG: threo-3-hydroxy-L-aspartate ammonia-lyase [Phycisphaerales bacterium]